MDLFVIKGDHNLYVEKLREGYVWFLKEIELARVFKSLEQANNFIKKHQWRVVHLMEIVKIKIVEVE